MPTSPESVLVTGLSLFDYSIVGAALLIMMAIGWWAGRREGSTEGFFLARRGIPGWAACLSFVATEISAMTIVGVPAEAYRSNWNYAQFFIGSALARVVVAYLFIPAFYECKCTTIYEFLRNRFGSATHTCSSLFFFVMRLLASGVRLYIAALAVSKILGISLLTSIIAFTIIPILFIGWGGIRAVIWTNVFQALVFIGAGFLVLGFLNGAVDGGLGGVFAGAFPIGAEATARAGNALVPEAKAVFTAAAESGSRIPYFFNMTWNTGPYETGTLMGALHALFGNASALWAGVLCGFFLSLASFGTDQENMQRLLTIETRKQSQRMLLWTIAAGGAVLLTYLAIGSGLAVWFAQHPGVPLPEKTDQIFPHFISQVLPHGLKGLLLAAIILASIDSPLISLATSAVKDIYEPLLARGCSDRHYLLVSRGFVIGFGVLLGGLALYFSRFDGILWVGFQIGSITFGSLLGVFLYGLMTKNRALHAPVAAMCINAMVMAALLFLISKKELWIAWSWLVVAGTGFTMVMTWAFAKVLGESAATGDVPESAVQTATAPLPGLDGTLRTGA